MTIVVLKGTTGKVSKLESEIEILSKELEDKKSVMKQHDELKEQTKEKDQELQKLPTIILLPN